jgi:hypothetical protein
MKRSTPFHGERTGLPPRRAYNSVQRSIPEKDRRADKGNALLVGQLPCGYRGRRLPVFPEYADSVALGRQRDGAGPVVLRAVSPGHGRWD